MAQAEQTNARGPFWSPDVQVGYHAAPLPCVGQGLRAFRTSGPSQA